MEIGFGKTSHEWGLIIRRNVFCLLTQRNTTQYNPTQSFFNGNWSWGELLWLGFDHKAKCFLFINLIQLTTQQNITQHNHYYDGHWSRRDFSWQKSFLIKKSVVFCSSTQYNTTEHNPTQPLLWWKSILERTSFTEVWSKSKMFFVRQPNTTQHKPTQSFCLWKLVLEKPSLTGIWLKSQMFFYQHNTTEQNST